MCIPLMTWRYLISRSTFPTQLNQVMLFCGPIYRWFCGIINLFIYHDWNRLGACYIVAYSIELNVTRVEASWTYIAARTISRRCYLSNALNYGIPRGYMSNCILVECGDDYMNRYINTCIITPRTESLHSEELLIKYLWSLSECRLYTHVSLSFLC